MPKDLQISKIFRNFASEIGYTSFPVAVFPVCRGQPSVHYNSPDEYANAFQQMIDAREKWREQIRQQEAQMAV